MAIGESLASGTVLRGRQWLLRTRRRAATITRLTAPAIHPRPRQPLGPLLAGSISGALGDPAFADACLPDAHYRPSLRVAPLLAMTSRYQ